LLRMRPPNTRCFLKVSRAAGAALFSQRDAQMPSGSSRLYYKLFSGTERLLGKKEGNEDERKRFRRGAALRPVFCNRFGGPEACLVAPAGRFGKTPTGRDRTYPRGCGILGGDVE